MDKIIYENYSNPRLASFKTSYPRIASRGLVFLPNGKMLAFVKHKSGQYKLPGGGKKGEESPEETFIREVLEETGYTIKNIQKLGIAKGYTQISNVFVADADEYKGENMDDDELAEDSRPIEISIDEFLEKTSQFIEKIKDGEDEDSVIRCAIALRDHNIVKYYKNNKI